MNGTRTLTLDYDFKVTVSATTVLWAKYQEAHDHSSAWNCAYLLDPGLVQRCVSQARTRSKSVRLGFQIRGAVQGRHRGLPTYERAIWLSQRFKRRIQPCRSPKWHLSIARLKYTVADPRVDGVSRCKRRPASWTPTYNKPCMPSHRFKYL